MGRKPGDRRIFKGSVSCLQIFKKALIGPQIRAQKRKCFRRSKDCFVTLPDIKQIHRQTERQTVRQKDSRPER